LIVSTGGPPNAGPFSQQHPVQGPGRLHRRSADGFGERRCEGGRPGSRLRGLSDENAAAHAERIPAFYLKAGLRSVTLTSRSQ
jgi:hypothetical protein